MILKDPPPCVMVNEQGASAVVLLLRVWCQNDDYWDLRYDLQEKVKLAFDQKGIAIPYNQLQLHLSSPIPSDNPKAAE